MAGDSCVSLGDGVAQTFCRTPKIWKQSGVLIGVAGDGAADYMIARIPWVASPQWLESHGAQLLAERAKSAEISCDVLIGIRGRLYQSDGHCTFPIAGRYGAIGCAEGYLIGFLEASQLPPHRRVAAAVRGAGKRYAGVGGRTWVVSSAV
jgi:hypothetical protein